MISFKNENLWDGSRKLIVKLIMTKGKKSLGKEPGKIHSPWRLSKCAWWFHHDHAPGDPPPGFSCREKKPCQVYFPVVARRIRALRNEDGTSWRQASDPYMLFMLCVLYTRQWSLISYIHGCVDYIEKKP